MGTGKVMLCSIDRIKPAWLLGGVLPNHTTHKKRKLKPRWFAGSGAVSRLVRLVPDSIRWCIHRLTQSATSHVSIGIQPFTQPLVTSRKRLQANVSGRIQSGRWPQGVSPIRLLLLLLKHTKDFIFHIFFHKNPPFFVYATSPSDRCPWTPQQAQIT